MACNSDPRVGDKRKEEYDGSLWPRRKTVKEANVIIAGQEDNWDTVEAVEVDNIRYNFYTEVAQGSVLLTQPQFRVSSGKRELCSLPTKPSPGSFPKAKLLREYVTRLLYIPLKFCDVPFPRRFPEIVQMEREVRMPRGEHDSDDEQIPDAAIFPPFTITELSIAQDRFEVLCEAYLVGRGVGFSNAAGKTLVEALMRFLQFVSPVSPFKCLHTTATGHQQPGAMSLKWQWPRQKDLRSPTEPVVDTRERYPACIVYDFVNKLNIIVVEIKVNEEDPSHAQNNEQMVGLWSNQQQAMLGLEVGGNTVRPKVLLLHGKILRLYCLQALKLTEQDGLHTLASFILAFLTFVEYVAPVLVPSDAQPQGTVTSEGTPAHD